MNLKQAIDASPYRAAQCEASNGRTFYVEPDESDEENLEAFDLKVAHGAMPAEVVGSYNGLASLIAALALDGGEPQEDSRWLPTGEEGEPDMDITDEMSSREHENAMIVDLCHEAGDTGSEAELIEGFRANHHADDIAAAASGDVAALVALRQACGLPVLR